jgi:hypothetical protein
MVPIPRGTWGRQISYATVGPPIGDKTPENEWLCDRYALKDVASEQADVLPMSNSTNSGIVIHSYSGFHLVRGSSNLPAPGNSPFTKVIKGFPDRSYERRWKVCEACLEREHVKAV